MKDTIIKKIFFVQQDLPPIEEFIQKGYLHALQIKIDNKDQWIIFRNRREVQLYEYLKSPKDYKAKEKMFDAETFPEYAYTTKSDGTPDYIRMVLPKKWLIKDKNIKRKLEIVIANKDQENDRLLHTLYSKVRQQK